MNLLQYNKSMHRARRSRGFFSNAVHHGKAFLGGMDGFFRHWGPAMKQVAMLAAPALAASNPAAASAVAAVGQAADSYSQLRQQLE